MNDYDKRAVELGKYIIERQCTIRKAAKVFGIAKSTVHTDVSKRLKKIKPDLAKSVADVLEFNLMVRHLRGGESTKQLFLKNHIDAK